MARKGGSASARFAPMKGKNDLQRPTPHQNVPAPEALKGKKLKK